MYLTASSHTGHERVLPRYLVKLSGWKFIRIYNKGGINKERVSLPILIIIKIINPRNCLSKEFKLRNGLIVSNSTIKLMYCFSFVAQIKSYHIRKEKRIT